MKVLRWDAASSLGWPENCSFIARFSKAALISYDSALVAGAIGVLIKSLLLVFEKSQSLVFSVMVTSASKQAHKRTESKREKRANEKGNFFVNFCFSEVGERKMRGKKGKCKRWVCDTYLDEFLTWSSPATAPEILLLRRQKSFYHPLSLRWFFPWRGKGDAAQEQ